MRTDPVIDLLLETLGRAFDQSSWHGPNLASSIRGIPAQAASRNLFNRKSIWQQVLHAAYWKQRVLNRLIGTQKFPRKGSNWPLLPLEITEKAWRADRDLLHAIHAELIDAVGKLDSRKLDAKRRKMILGAAAHDVYHAGQINLLKRAMRES